MKTNKQTIFLGMIALFLFIFIFWWIHFLSKNKYVVLEKGNKGQQEAFSPVIPNLLNFGAFHSSLTAPQKNSLYGIFPTFPTIIENYEDKGTPETSHTVTLPINTSTSCSNMCINGRCSYTGQQCLADIDCPGCNGYKGENPNAGSANVPGNDENGKLTTAFTPNYSPLTTTPGIMTAAIFSKANMGRASPPANFGPNLYKTSTDYAQERFYKRYKPVGLPFQPKYPVSNSVTGLVLDEGPLPSNYFE